MNVHAPSSTGVPLPDSLLAELTHRCPLACPYCSNPMELKAQSDELSTETWISVFEQAAALGVLHLHLSGGEPASRRDLEELTRGAAKAGLYTNLITSGIGLTEKRMDRLAEAGLDHVQLSLQGVDAAMADRIAGYAGGLERKLAVAGWVTARNMPLTVNAVCHAQNFDRLDDMIALAVNLGARRLEIATVQFHGWAVANRNQLMPTREQAKIAGDTVRAARQRLKGVLVIDYVPADYHATYPKACMGGWGRTGLNVDPSGQVLPCHAAETIKHLTFDNVKDRALADIWFEGEAFNAYRGFDWMREPCRTCERRELDFGGCRCQAMALAGDAAATDPVCAKSPQHLLVANVTGSVADTARPFVYRGRQVS
jgi:PqqA peptide cyclase